MRSLPVICTVVSLALALGVSTASAVAMPVRPSDFAPVVVPRGQPLQIAFADSLTGSTAPYGPSLEHAVQMAVESHPTIRGVPIQVNVVDAPCGDAAADVAAAEAIAANAQNVAVLGQVCSTGFDQALQVYEAAGLVTISGSATNDALPAYGPNVFDRTTVDDGDGFEAWYATVSQLPADVAWRQAYTFEFGAAPSPFADLYYDAAGLLLRDLEKVSAVDRRGDLVVFRPLVARAVRDTTRYRGVSCTVSIDPRTGNRLNDPVALSRCATGAR